MEFILEQGFILIIPQRAANILIVTDMVTLSDDFHPVMYSLSSPMEVMSPRMTLRVPGRNNNQIFSESFTL